MALHLSRRLPCTPIPPNPRGPRRWLSFLTWALWIALAAAPVAVVAQFERSTLKNLARAEDENTTETKFHKGAIGRWRHAVHQFWDGYNIYGPGNTVHHLPGRSPRADIVHLHPNSPPVLPLLTPFAYMPVWLMALSWNLLKLAMLVPTAWMAMRLANHRHGRMPHWVALAGLLMAMEFIISDLQHGNTNVFVAAAVVAHLWLFRRGRDVWSGLALALGVVLKMTPALFLLYWLYQRQWKLVAALLAGLVVLMAVLPAATMGPARAWQVTGAWWDGLIRPGLVDGAWYPTHVNQSLPGMVARYFIGPPDTDGDIMSNPDDLPAPDPAEARWITVADLGPKAARWLLRALQAAIVLTAAWAIGRRRLPRDDGRRALHYGMVTAMMLLLNQRSWDHHAAHLIVAHLALSYAIFQGRLGRRTRLVCGALLAASFAGTFLLSGDVLKIIGGAGFDDVVEAYGRSFWHFLTVWGLCVVLAVKLRNRPQPYDDAEPAAAAPQSVAMQSSTDVSAVGLT